MQAKRHSPSQVIYDKNYWTYQKGMGLGGAVLDRFKFEEFIHPSDIVIDFGCGGGFLLKEFSAVRKIGIEINASAYPQMIENGIEAYRSIADVPDNVADVIISNHALEHVFHPYEVLCELKSKLKRGGLLIIVVPSEQACNQEYTDNYEYKENDVNHHVYTWTPLTLGNLIKFAGFEIIKSEALRHCWVGNFHEESKSPLFNLEEYHARCRAEAIRTGNYQVRVVARKP